MAKINISKAGGSAGAGARTCKVTLPTTWLSTMGLGSERRGAILTFDGEQIVLSPVLSMEEYAGKKQAMGHQVLELRYYDDTRLCTLIYADFSDMTLQAENYTDLLIKTAFGKKVLPIWQDFQTFLEERCIPRGRVGIREYLMDIGLSEYDPLEIVKRTEGRMAEDDQWLEVRELT